MEMMLSAELSLTIFMVLRGWVAGPGIGPQQFEKSSGPFHGGRIQFPDPKLGHAPDDLFQSFTTFTAQN